MVTVRLYGSISHVEQLRAEFRKHFHDDVGFRFGDPTDDQRSPDVSGCDLIVCGFGPAADAAPLLDFLGRVVGTYGAWSYLPQVVVGSPADPRLQRALLRLGASAYLDVDDPTAGTADRFAETVARKAYETWRATWWQTECRREVPSLVVNRRGVVERANPFAVRRFGPLAGRPYAAAVEGNAFDELPPDHPIACTFRGPRPKDRRWGRSVSVDHKFRGADGREGWFFLTCNPLVVPSGAVWAASVGLFEMSRWARIIDASNTFAAAGSREELLVQVVEQAGRLGFSRVRLYQHAPAEKRLYGRLAVGFRNPDVRTHFETRFWIPETDPSTAITFQRQRACLYIDGTGPRTEFTEHIPEPHQRSAELEWEGVSRWIEAPIFLPPSAAAEEPTAWGKLSLDLGRSSEQLTSRDVGDVAVFCSIVGHALGMMRRVERRQLEVERRQRQRDLLSALSADLVAVIRPDEPILGASIEKSLALIMEVTGGDAALYRRYDPVHPDALRLHGRPAFRDPSAGLRFSALVPADIPRVRATGGYFRHFVGGTARTERAYVAADTPAEMSRFGAGIDARHRPWLEFIRSELHVPVVRGDAVVGVILVSSGRDAAFTPAVAAEVEQYVPAISLGLEAARRHDDWLVMGNAVRRVVGELHQLAEIPLDRDDAFFAALATVLSAAQGLRWNRVFVWSCKADTPPDTTELVYALGGLARDTPPPPDEDAAAYGDATHRSHAHRLVQEKFRTDRRFEGLADLVRHRIRHPEPHWRSPDGADERRDLLYDLVIAAPRRGAAPILADPAEPPRSAGDAADVEYTNPIASLLRIAEEALPPECDPLTIRMNHRNRWVMDMAGQYPGMFDPDDKAFLFLLQGLTTPHHEPLGLVWVDMQTAYEVDEQDMVAATRIVLRLAAGILADRYHRRRHHGIIRSLPARSHGPTLVTEWATLQRKVFELMEPVAGGLDTGDPRACVRAVAQALTPEAIDGLQQTMTRFGERIARLQGGDEPLVIDDLGRTLREWKRYYAGRSYGEVAVQVVWETAVEGLRVPCDPIVLKEAVGTLIDNSREEGRRLGRQLQVLIHVDVVETGCRAIPRVVELDYNDDGDGIDEKHLRRVLIDGYTLADSPSGKGRGLALVKRQLLEYKGCLECRPSAKGVWFAIQLGIPAAPTDPIGSGRMATVLIVSDETDQRANIEYAAGRAGFAREECYSAPAWDAAVTAIRGQPFAVAVVDLELWGRLEGGVDLIRELRQLQPTCVIVALTERRGDDAGRRASSVGATAFLNGEHDPAWPATLQKRLEAYRRKLRTPAAPTA